MHFKNLPLARFCVAQMRTMSDKIKKSGQLSEKRLFKKNWTKKKVVMRLFFLQPQSKQRVVVYLLWKESRRSALGPRRSLLRERQL